MGIVDVPDARLQALADIVHPSRIMPATVEFVDIAGLVKGAAAEGAGLGNQFLANIRECDAICEVVRYFKDPDVMREANHTGEFVDPASDAETIMTELILADIQTLEKQLPKLEKEVKRDKALAPKLDIAKRLLDWLNDGKRAANMEMTDEERAAAKGLFLLTLKPMLYVANVDERRAHGRARRHRRRDAQIPICAKVEAELSELEPEEAAEYLARPGPEAFRPGDARPGGVQAAGPAELFHRWRDGGPRVDGPSGRHGSPGRRRDPHGLRARLHQGRGRGV